MVQTPAGHEPSAAEVAESLGLSSLEQEIADTYLAGGQSMRAAFAAVVGEDQVDTMTEGQIRRALRNVEKRTRPYRLAIRSEAADRAGVTLEGLIEQAHADREFAQREGNAAAAIAATKLIAQLSGHVAKNGSHGVQAVALGAVALLEAVEEKARRDAAQRALVDVTPRRRG